MNLERDDHKRAVADAFSETASFYDQTPAFHVYGLKLVDAAGVSAGNRVLDVATGRGAVLFPAQEKVGQAGHVTGIDIAPGMVEATTAEVARKGSYNVDVVVMDAERLEFPDASFDVVLCGFGVMFIPNLQGSLAEMRRVLRGGGVIAVSTWSSNGEINQRYVTIAQAFSAARPPLGLHRLNVLADLQAALRVAGFSDIRCYEDSLETVYEDEEAWWKARPALPQLASLKLDARAQQELQVESFAMLQEFKDSAGIHETRVANFAVASKGNSEA